jgi:hypothetical protein
MTAMTGDTIAAFVGPALGLEGEQALDDVRSAHPAVRLEQRIPVAGAREEITR